MGNGSFCFKKPPPIVSRVNYKVDHKIIAELRRMKEGHYELQDKNVV